MYIQLLLLLILMSSCSKKEIKDIPSFGEWINQTENGLIRIKKINNLKLSVKYLPPEYLALREVSEVHNSTRIMYDSLLKLYKKNSTFILNISPEGANGNKDVMYAGVNNYKEYKQRVFDLNFDFSSYVFININDKLYPAKLSNLENTYSISNDRNFYLVFSDSILNTGNDIDFVFDDEIFNTGISHFEFQAKDLKKIPEVNFYKN